MRNLIFSKVNSLLSSFTCHVPIYHATYPTAPKEIRDRLHNVAPVTFQKQIEWYAKYFKIVPIDELFESHRPWGKASITFDDAYNSVFDHALPMLIEMGIPATVFVIGSTLEGKVFWRDKIRYLINNNLINDFLNFAGNCNFHLTHDNFYRNSKSIEVNSRLLDITIDRFFSFDQYSFHIDNIENYCVTSPDALIKNPLITYGNHTHNHYVLPSLNRNEQLQEIAKTEALLKGLDVKRSRIFSVPFGNSYYVNHTTLTILKEFQFRGLLFDGKQANWGKLKNYYLSIPVIWRYMAPTQEHSFNREILSRLIFPIRNKLSHNFFNK